MATERRLVYADSSALVKLLVEEAETVELRAHLAGEVALASSRLALTEVPRAVAVADSGTGVRAEAEGLLSRCLLVEVTEGLLRQAARLAPTELRTLDAIHLASALRVEPDEMLVYDHRLRRAADAAGLPVGHPGTP